MSDASLPGIDPGVFAPFPLSGDQINSLLQPTCLMTGDQIAEDHDRHRLAVHAVRNHPFAVALLGLCRTRLGCSDPITRGIVSLILGVPGASPPARSISGNQ